MDGWPDRQTDGRRGWWLIHCLATCNETLTTKSLFFITKNLRVLLLSFFWENIRLKDLCTDDSYVDCSFPNQHRQFEKQKNLRTTTKIKKRFEYNEHTKWNNYILKQRQCQKCNSGVVISHYRSGWEIESIHTDNFKEKK